MLAIGSESELTSSTAVDLHFIERTGGQNNVPIDMFNTSVLGNEIFTSELGSSLSLSK